MLPNGMKRLLLVLYFTAQRAVLGCPSEFQLSPVPWALVSAGAPCSQTRISASGPCKVCPGGSGSHMLSNVCLCPLAVFISPSSSRSVQVSLQDGRRTGLVSLLPAVSGTSLPTGPSLATCTQRTPPSFSSCFLPSFPSPSLRYCSSCLLGVLRL